MKGDSADALGPGRDPRAALTLGQLVRAAGLDPEALIGALKGRLSSFKVPRRIVLLRREDVPMIRMSGKVDRHALRDLVTR